MRLFVALQISAEVREQLSKLIRELRDVDSRPKWANPDNLHVTLKFIGEVAPEKTAAIGDALVAIRADGSVVAQFRGIGFFPNARRPDVAWVGIHASPIISELAAQVNRALEPLGIPGEEKPFVAHLTIARFKETRLSRALRVEMERQNDREFGTLASNEFHLIQSKRKSAGAEYTTLRSFRFAAKESQG